MLRTLLVPLFVLGTGWWPVGCRHPGWPRWLQAANRSGAGAGSLPGEAVGWWINAACVSEKKMCCTGSCFVTLLAQCNYYDFSSRVRQAGCFGCCSMLLEETASDQQLLLPMLVGQIVMFTPTVALWILPARCH